MRPNQGPVLWLLALLASLPTLLIAYLGQFSRLMGDDWCFFNSALHLGGRDYFSFWLNNWHSSLTYIAIHDILAPLGPEYMPPIFPAIIFGLWLLGLAWLFFLVLRGLQLDANRLPVALILAFLSLAAFVIGVYDWEPLYWYSASIRHSLPVGIFLLVLTLFWEAASRQSSGRRLAVLAAAGAAACFVNAGLSQLQTILQLICLTLMLLAIRAFIDSSRRRPCLALYSAGWVGNAAGLIVQLVLPGSATRMSDMGTGARYDQIRALPELIVETVETSAAFIGHPGNIAGFTLLFAAGLVAALLLVKPIDGEPGRRPAAAKAGAGARYWSAALLLGAFASLALTQVAGLHFLASAILYICALILLVVLAARLAAATSDFLSRRIFLAALVGSALAYGSLALSIAVGHFSIGIIYERTLTFAALLSVLSGLAWGGCIGFLLRRRYSRTPGEAPWLRGVIGLGSLALALAYLSIVSMQAGLIPDFATYAREWDARHQRIVRLREGGEQVITVTPYSYHMTQAISPVDLEIVGWDCQPYYYGLEAIAMEP